MRETKVNLKHLLEDIRDSYTITIEEIILLELIANALDSGASRISFFIDFIDGILTVTDNGKGMKRRELSDYHNIAATTKLKGRGIGFAGVGAKLSLLLAEKVCTETKGGYGSRCATEWYLKNETSAPWKFIPFSGKVLSPRGTAISIKLKNKNSRLLSENFIKETAYKHFFPLFYVEPFSPILRHIYKRGVEFFINNKKVVFESQESFFAKNFQIRLGGRHRALAGAGFLARATNSPNDVFLGLAISTFGKIIKSGWEWIGIAPKEQGQIFGIIEIPALSEILTTNKMDFLKDAASLKKYYQYRKNIQETILPILKEFGENINLEISQKQYKSLQKEIERTIRSVLENFPELTPLLGVKNIRQKQSAFSASVEPSLVSIVNENTGGLKVPKKPDDDFESGKTERESKKDILTGAAGKKAPGLVIGFEQRLPGESIARMMENKIWINNSHPAYIKAKQEELDEYHIVFSVALTLSSFLEDKHLPQEFINDFLASWGAWGINVKKPNNLFKIS